MYINIALKKCLQRRSTYISLSHVEESEFFLHRRPWLVPVWT